MSILFRSAPVQRSAQLSATLRALGLHDRSGTSSPVVNGDTALSHSAVWACLRLRADLISMMPIDAYRTAGGVQVEVPKPPLLVTPDGHGIEEWMYATQFDLDRYGNTFGIITEVDGTGLPRRIDLVPASDVSVRATGAVVTEYVIAGVSYRPEQVWHERQFTAAGMPVGLSPIMYAAWSVGTYLSAQEFASDWFSSDAAPAGHLRNTLKPTVNPDEAVEVKSRWKAAITGRDVFVTGRDWEYTMNAVPANSVMFLDEMKYGIADVCRFFGVPGDMVDAETGSGSITYANVTQRNLQLLIMNIGPAVNRREKALSRALPAPRFVKLNTDAVLRMDPQTRSTVLGQQVTDRLLAPSEARALDNREPFTDAQLAEFDRIFGSANKTPQPVQQAAAPSVTVNTPPVTVNMPAIDARSDVTVQAPPVPEVHNNYEHVIDARTSLEPGAVTVDARTDVAVPERAVTVTVEAAPAVEPALTRKRIETDDKGRIVGVTEERIHE